MIDGGYFDNLNHYLKINRGKKIHVEKFSHKITEGMTHLRTKFYHANPYQSEVPTEPEKKKYEKAQKFQYAVNNYKNHEFVAVGRVKPMHIHCPLCDEDYEIPKQKGVDVAIALDLVKMSQKKVADVFILVTGDEDFTNAVEMAKESLAQTIIYFASDSAYGIYGSVKLNKTADDRVRMDLDFLEECAMD